MHNNKTIIIGKRNLRTGLWEILPTSKGDNTTSKGKKKSNPKTTANTITEQCNNVHRLNKITDVLQYLHAALFSPKKATLLQAVKNNNLTTWPGMTITNVITIPKHTIVSITSNSDVRSNVSSTNNSGAFFVSNAVIAAV